MSLSALRLTLYIMGLLIVLVGGITTFFGIHTTAQVFAPLADVLLGDTRPVDHFAHPDVDSEMRFYSVIFMAYGLVILHTAANLKVYMDRVPALILVFFVGGAARALTHIYVGNPHGLFDILMTIELGAPVLIYILYRRAQKRLF